MSLVWHILYSDMKQVSVKLSYLFFPKNSNKEFTENSTQKC